MKKALTAMALASTACGHSHTPSPPQKVSSVATIPLELAEAEDRFLNLPLRIFPTTTTIARRSPATTAKRPVTRPSPFPGRVPAVPKDMTDDQLLKLRMCESGGRYGLRNPPYSGAYQFTRSTWRSIMGTQWSEAADAPPGVQDDAARRLYARSGRGQWPICGKRAGLA